MSWPFLVFRFFLNSFFFQRLLAVSRKDRCWFNVNFWSFFSETLQVRKGIFSPRPCYLKDVVDADEFLPGVPGDATRCGNRKAKIDENRMTWWNRKRTNKGMGFLGSALDFFEVLIQKTTGIRPTLMEGKLEGVTLYEAEIEAKITCSSTWSLFPGLGDFKILLSNLFLACLSCLS